ncbi:MAG TPA: ABC transporter permease [Polyangiaceae bacterium]|nr:ABC transporter permease [Polyangiaceae bacterium]
MSALDVPAPRRVSYFTLVWRELARDRLAVFGLRAIVVLVALAAGAPLVSSNQPFWYLDAHGWSSPWLVGLFDRLVFESSVDVFFNLLLVLAPLYALVHFALARGLGARFDGRRRKLVLGFGLGFVALFLALTPAKVAGLDNPLHYSHPVQNYRAKVAADHGASAVFALHHYGYRETNPDESLKPPSGEHWLGTDQEGRDVFARMLYGTRISLSIGVVAVALYVFIGVVVGALAGYFGGWVDSALSRLIEVMICFPTFFLILTLAALIRERSIFHVMVIIGITSWTGVARLVRAEFLKHKGLEYAQAARALGIPVRRIIFTHILPNASAPVLVSATFGIASSILVESSLSFLGIGDPNVASWGETLNAGRVDQRLWLILAPGIAIFFVVTVFNLVGEGLRDALDPKLRR